MNNALVKRMRSPGPKKILACDGGGILGLMSVEILAKLEDDLVGRNDCNLRLPLWQLVRASTAAPTYFPPEVITLAEGTPQAYTFIFVDGGVTTYNNPAFLAFQMATAGPYAVNWKTGVDALLIVSVGTGGAAKAQPELRPENMHLLYNASTLPGALMNAASAGWDMSCRMLGECRFGGRIDREVDTMLVAPGAPPNQPPNWTGPKLFAYARYDPDVTSAGLAALGLPEIDAQAMQAMDSVENMPDIQRVGTAFAQRHVTLDHLRGFC
jgi:uncharacterized protein